MSSKRNTSNNILKNTRIKTKKLTNDFNLFVTSKSKIESPYNKIVLLSSFLLKIIGTPSFQSFLQ